MVSRERGFTLVELSLAIAFLSILLLAILTITIQSGKLYAKGLIYKSINQVSREVVDILRRDFISSDGVAIVVPPQQGTGDKLTGRVCTGQVSYAWNTAALLNDLSSTQPKITINGNPAVFARVPDPGKALCSQISPGVYPMNITLPGSTELLSTDGRTLAVYRASVTKIIDDGTRRGLFNISLEIGTNEEGTSVYDASTNQYTCRPPTDNTANFEYCTVVGFDTIVRAGGSL